MSVGIKGGPQYPVIFGPESGSVFDKVKRPLGMACTDGAAIRVARRRGITCTVREKLTARLAEQPDLENENGGKSVKAWFVGVSLR